VNSLPNVSTINLSGPTLLCDGESVTLSVPSTSGYIYKWRDDYGYIPGATSTSYTADVTGSYQLEISNTSSCSVMTQQVDVTVNPVPSAPVIDPGSYTLDECPGEAPTKISVDQPVAGYIYQWLRNGEPISGETKTYLEGYLDQADYAVDAILNSCSARSQTLEIFYQNAPEKPTVYAVGPTVWYLACSNNTAATYRWYYNGVLIPGADKYYYIANQKMGEYAVSIANEQGCYTMSDAITIPITGIEETDVFSGLKIYPNPTPGIFTVEMNNQVFGEMNIDIFNTEGKIILRLKVEKSTEHFMTHVDLSGQVKGIYLVNMKLDKYNKVSKLIID